MAKVEVPDFSSVPEASIDELARQGEVCLQGTVQLAIAADFRSTTMAGIFGAGSVALLAVSATIIAGAKPDAAFVIAALVTSLLLFAAALLCAWAARPIDFYVAGYEPRKLAKSAADLVWMKRFAVEDVQVRISKNRAALDAAASYLKRGALIAGSAPLTGVLVYAFWTFCKG